MDVSQTTTTVLHEISYLDAVFRILCAMAIGIIVGVERGRSQRPAGMRTHMLVALGACMTMIVSNFLFVDFRPLGATPDPARLGAQVVSGVGFLGAGTIMREGLSIKGLTTAASIWAVACLGLAAGAGYYVIALTGAGAVYATLTVFESVQRKMNVSRHTTLALDMECTDLSGVMHDLNRFALQENATLSHVQFDETEQRSVYHLTAVAVFHSAHPQADQAFFWKNSEGTQIFASWKLHNTDLC